MARPGRLAWQLGPCLASAEAGRRLLDDAALRYAGQRVFLDITEGHSAAREWACERGLSVQAQAAADVPRPAHHGRSRSDLDRFRTREGLNAAPSSGLVSKRLEHRPQKETSNEPAPR